MAYTGLPAFKRQKTYTDRAASAFPSKTYDSGEDDGDSLFADWVPDTPAKYETQPTQILDQSVRTPRLPSSPPVHVKDTVQVPASSPLPPKHVPLPRPKKNNLASLMAPAGTNFRAPAGVLARPAPAKVVCLDSDDDVAPIVIDSSEDESAGKADIKSSVFGNDRKRQSEDAVSPFNGSAKFQNVMMNSVYDPQNLTGKRKLVQKRPERARPVDSGRSVAIDSDKLRANITRIRMVFPQVKVDQARAVLVKCRGSLDDAVDLLGAVDDDDCVELLPSSVKPAQPQMKRGLEGPVASIKDRYSKTQSQSRLADAPAPPSKKRKLMQGRKQPSSPPPRVSSPVKPSSPIVSLKDFGDESDSGVGSESEPDLASEGRLLEYLNSCQLDDLIELTSTAKVNAERMLAARPFKNLDAARAVTDGKALKSGKKSTKAPMGERLVENAMQMFSGYEAVDSLVAQCEEIGKPLAEEMSKWGYDSFGASKDGELELTSFDDERDSGIGSPSSGNVSINGEEGDEESKTTLTKSRKQVNLIKKPEMMADDVVLKDYQIVGLNWIDMMYRHKLSCMLADDMGLGKTCQVIAFLAHLVETDNTGPHLVIATASTLVNWLQEFEKFAPQLIVEPYHGSQAERHETADKVLNNRESFHVIVTTYDMATRKEDGKFLRQLKPDVMVCDEGHLLKNAMTQRNQALARIPAKFRIILTGTPLQNNLQELATLLAFILPGVFKAVEEDLACIFKHKASTRDADHGALLSAQRITRARSMLTPFVLRRKKHQVLKHLPSKECRTEYCDLLPAQRSIYDTFITQALDRARIKLEGGKIPKSDENNPLMQLRKAAVHPLLFRRHFTDKKIERMADILRKKLPEHFDPEAKREHLINEMRKASDFWLHQWCVLYPCISSFDIPDLAWLDSGKVSALVSLLKKYKENGDRVLVFSQFALVLDILEAVLNTSFVTYTRIDGSTRIDERQTLIDNFRDDESITAFLLTTKAGGTGINLMYANKVIIFDMSFNPQDDVQAENRAHRVGQHRDVEVVRLVTRGTVEESIYKLGKSKLELDGRVAGEEAGEEVGARMVEKMMLDGLGDSAGPKLKDGENKKSEGILFMATQGTKDVDGEEMLV